VTVKLLEADGMTGSTVFQLVGELGEDLPQGRRPVRERRSGRRR
jgi:hypothetical protein